MMYDELIMTNEELEELEEDLYMTREELIALISEDVDDSECSHMTEEEEETIKTIAKGDYYGFDEDIDAILAELDGWNKESINWQTIADIVAKGEWYFQEEE